MKTDIPEKQERFKALVEIAHRFEEVVVLILYLVIAVITIIALMRLGAQIYTIVFSEWNTTNTYSIQLLFGMTLTVLIALELGNSILRHLREGSTIIQAQEIILIGMMAVVRKVMLVDMSTVSHWKLTALAAVSLALATAYWFTRKSD
jgi:uncharacterized membrane protein (DUF373 family)